MYKMVITAAMFFLSPAFAAIPALSPSTQTQQPEQSQSVTVMSAQGAGGFDHLSMGPDPGGKTGDTVTPTTTKTGQPSYDGTGASNQSGASSTAVPGDVSDRTEKSTGATSASDKPKQ